MTVEEDAMPYADTTTTDELLCLSCELLPLLQSCQSEMQKKEVQLFPAGIVSRCARYDVTTPRLFSS